MTCVISSPLVTLVILSSIVAVSACSPPPSRLLRYGEAPASSERADAVTEQSAPLTLDDALAVAEARSPALAAASAELTLGEAEVVAASVASQHNPVVSTGVGGRIAEGHHSVAVEAAVEQSFEIAGERSARQSNAERLRSLSKARFELTLWRVRHQVRCLFQEALLARQRLAAAQRMEQFSEEILAVLARQIELGDVPPLVIFVANTEHAQAQQDVVAAQGQVRSSLLRLAEAIGWPPERPLEIDGELCPPRRAPTVADLLERAVDNNPSHALLLETVAAAEAGIVVADREAWPEPSLGVSYAREGAPGSSPHMWMVTLGIPLPFFDRNQGDRARARAAAVVARANVSAWTSGLRARLGQAAAQVDAAVERIEIFGTDIAPGLEQNLALVQRAFELGEVDIHQVSQLRQRILEAERTALDAMEDYYRAAAELQSVVGTDLWVGEPATGQQEEQ